MRERSHKNFDGSTGLLDLDFIFIFRGIDLRNGAKDGDSDGTLFQSDGKTFTVFGGKHLRDKGSLYFKKSTGRGELIFNELALEGVDGGFW